MRPLSDLQRRCLEVLSSGDTLGPGQVAYRINGEKPGPVKPRGCQNALWGLNSRKLVRVIYRWGSDSADFKINEAGLEAVES